MDNNIILFDGVCNLCNRLFKFIYKRDKKYVFTFGSIQSKPAQILLKKYDVNVDLDSFILIKNNKVYKKSSAIIHVGLSLKGFYLLSAIFFIIPKPIRDFIYDIVAKNRYKWFGKRDKCIIPTKDMKERFLN